MTRKLPDFHTMLAELVALPSVSSTSGQLDMSNRGVVEKLADWLETLGFDVELQSIPKPGAQVEGDGADKFNLIARRGAGNGGLVLAGHTDTVPWDENRWSTDPFTIAERDNRFYGLGSTDMKGFFPVALEALQSLDMDRLTAPITVVATADEESSMSGAEFLLAKGEKLADFTIIGEPTDLIPIRMHKGMMMEMIRVQGQSGHSSDPSLGLNALEVMHRVIAEMLQFRNELQSGYQHPGFSIPVPTLNFGCIHGGDNPNRICGNCELQFDLRPIPGLPLDELRDQVSRRLDRIAGESGAKIELTRLFNGIESFEQEADSQLVKLAEEYSGNQSASVAFATEAPFFQKLGSQTIVLGPGSINQAHQPDEYLPMQQIKPAITLYKKFIERFCFDT